MNTLGEGLMSDREYNLKQLDEGANLLFVDLTFDLASGDSYMDGCTYEDQLEHYLSIVIPNSDPKEYLEYGFRCRLSSKFIFLGRPEKIKSREFLLKLYCSFVTIKELYDVCNYEEIFNFASVFEQAKEQVSLEDENDQLFVEKEIGFLVKRYTESLDEDVYERFLNIMRVVEEDFSKSYNRITGFVRDKSGSIEELLSLYGITDSIRFHLVVDAVSEIATIKNQQLDYFDEFRDEWEKRFPTYPFGEEVKNYVKTKERAFVISYGGNINSIRNENLLYIMLMNVSVKLAIAEGAKDNSELIQKIREQNEKLVDEIKETLVSYRDRTIRKYHLNSKEDYHEELRSAMIPFKTDLLYLRDIIIEEISLRNNGDDLPSKSRINKDISEYELLLSQKEAELLDLRHELEYYENIKQQEFKTGISQYNKALTDLFIKLCDRKYNSPLNELYLMANGNKETNQSNIRTAIQNMLFILSTMDITPYETGNVGKKVNFYDDEANNVYSVDEKHVKEGINKGIQVYPGWRYKDIDLVLPRVEVEE